MWTAQQKDRLTIAVTGLNATDNPGPGVAVIRALRAHPRFKKARFVGLVYDALEPGIYHPSLTDALFLVPYPSAGPDALLERLRYIKNRLGGLDVIIPTLDAELPSFIALQETLAANNIHTFLPFQSQLECCSKSNLASLGSKADILVPEQRVVHSASELLHLHKDIPLPYVVKGPYYGAAIVRSTAEAITAFHRFAAEWGTPVIVQRYVQGQELNVIAVGDGCGGLVGAVPMKKTFITDKGKGWAGITIRDDTLMTMAKRFMAATSWRGPCELEVIRDSNDNYHLLELNPRFPAWAYLSVGAGMNLPAVVIQLALGESVLPMKHYIAGTMFVRIAIDQIAYVSDLEAITTVGEVISDVTLATEAA